ncbi:hypothetical protein MANES_18G066550v8 [Manihot esculenta]|uniref:phosphoglycerate mutase (2,3-diphosphoglycerate-dependent) n=1 Tax=Manihot esculenta TaxID=3983 RepID=A0A2C9U1B1_MANES|nr:hypothetical protein MANES_18G066550v8 [Manihot esculenta]
MEDRWAGDRVSDYFQLKSELVATIQAIKEHKEFYSYQALQTVDAHGLLPNFHHKCL